MRSIIEELYNYNPAISNPFLDMNNSSDIPDVESIRKALARKTQSPFAAPTQMPASIPPIQAQMQPAPTVQAPQPVIPMAQGPMPGFEAPQMTMQPNRPDMQIPMATGSNTGSMSIGDKLKGAWGSAKETLANPQTQYLLASLGASLAEPGTVGERLGKTVMDATGAEMYQQNISDALAGRAPTFKLPSGEMTQQAMQTVQALQAPEIEHGYRMEEIGAKIEAEKAIAATKLVDDTQKNAFDEAAKTARKFIEGIPGTGNESVADKALASISGEEYINPSKMAAFLSAVETMEALSPGSTASLKPIYDLYKDALDSISTKQSPPPPPPPASTNTGAIPGVSGSKKRK